MNGAAIAFAYGCAACTLIGQAFIVILLISLPDLLPASGPWAWESQGHGHGGGGELFFGLIALLVFCYGGPIVCSLGLLSGLLATFRMNDRRCGLIAVAANLVVGCLPWAYRRDIIGFLLAR